ncbi:acyltransferase family protein [Paucibacter sp. KCTC 42545]|uniref:acyltransferase family protein n=1 Tax=Paucibacter sp. KCTC 42545 TaxID=1768242 RepID=UPI000733BE8F|nr:acyltransferase [Paucibacter sp. KCTC 42545]ALT77272.1 hypothetical protein AT984_08770 [Paucibacter sp. KCTC 42545]
MLGLAIDSSAKPDKTKFGLWGDQFSIYLDLVRFLAATYVMLAHTKYPRFTDGWLSTIGSYANDAVMVFFVLSGLVIAQVTIHQNRGFADYALARLSRLWSVALPALLITYAADSLGRNLMPELYEGNWAPGDMVFWRLSINALFAGELWFLNLLPFSNVPYWSINYEFWYYAIFASLYFLRGSQRIIATTFCTLICGPKILLLLPVWLLGIAANWLITRTHAHSIWGLLLGLLTPLIYAIYSQSGIHGHLNWMTANWLGIDFTQESLAWSKSFLSNYIVGSLVMLHFYGAAISLKNRNPFGEHSKKWIRSCANYTFSIYLLHMPLLQLNAAILKLDPADKLDWLSMMLLTIFIVILIGEFTEKRKHKTRTALKKLSENLSNSLGAIGIRLNAREK